MELDRDVVNLAKAIRQAESGNRAVLPQEGSSVGGASRYQYTHDTWKGVAQKYLGDANAPLTSQNENKASYLRIKEWKDSGKNVGQIASMWNAGEGRPNAYKENWRGVNKHGVVYDTPAYAKKVATEYQKLKGASPTSAAPAVAMPQQEERKPFSLGNLAKEVVSPVTTMLARPFQAVQSGAQYFGTKKENPELLEKAKQYSDEAYRLAMKVRTIPEGPERDRVQAEAEQMQKLSLEFAGKQQANVNYQPFSTDILIKPAPETYGDIKKDVGRGIQTAAFGLGPVAGGAAFGTGMSLEQGNDLLSWDTLAYTVFGAGLGKAADIVGKPLLDATGNAIGKITPEMLKVVAAGGTKAVQSFMEKNKLLPDALSRPINRGAAALETGANAPFKAAGNLVTKTDDQVIQRREAALKALEEKYAQLRDNAARNPTATAATRGRVARSNVLTEDNMINDDGVIIGAKQASKNYVKENVGDGESLVKQLLQKEGVSVDIEAVERQLAKVIKESFTGRELISATNALRREIAGLRALNKNGRVSLVDAHKSKVDRQPGSKAYDNSETKKIDKQLARGYKELIENNSSQNIKSINEEIGKYLEDARYIASLEGKRIGSGKLGKATSRIGGAVAGAAAGGAIGGLPGVAVGSYIGGAVSQRLAGRGLKKALGRATSKTPVESPILAAGRAKLGEKQLALPPASGQAPIAMPPVNRGIGPVAVKAPKGEVARNPKTGKFMKTYKSDNEPFFVPKGVKPTKSVSEQAYKDTVANGGVTISLAGDKPVKGLAYAPRKDTERVIDKKNFSPKDVDKYIDDYADELNKPGNHLGTWEEDGKIYMDISKVGENTPETIEKAMKANQLGVFDLETFETLTLGKIENGVYTRVYGKKTNIPDLNGGKDKGANPKGSAGELQEVPGSSKITSLATAKTEKAIDKKLAIAPASKTYIDTEADQIAGKYGDAAVVAKAPIKGRDRAIEKAIKEEGGDAEKLRDLARNTIMPMDKKTQQKILDDMDARKDLVKRKDQHPEDYMGYEGIIYNVETPNGLIAETQVVMPNMIYGKMSTEEAKKILGVNLYNKIKSETGVEGELGHKFYEQYRKLSIADKEGAKGQQITEQSIEYYNKLR